MPIQPVSAINIVRVWSAAPKNFWPGTRRTV